MFSCISACSVTEMSRSLLVVSLLSIAVSLCASHELAKPATDDSGEDVAGAQSTRLIKNPEDFDKLYTKRAGQTVKFYCALRCNSTGTWLHRGTPLVEKARVRILRKANGDLVLRIKRVKPSDNGKYECIVTDAVAKSETRKSLSLAVLVHVAPNDDRRGCGDVCSEFDQSQLPDKVQRLTFGSLVRQSGWATQGGSSITIDVKRSRKLTPEGVQTISSEMERANSCFCLAAITLYPRDGNLSVTVTGTGLRTLRSSSGSAAPGRMVEPEEAAGKIVYTCGVYQGVNPRCVGNNVGEAVGKWKWTVVSVPLTDHVNGRFVCSV
eukprot:m.18192 g.18192  ORF g.18192 m.18192 type:complete len:323 (+) comp27614_c0_seq2:429-1397(+)